MSSTEESISAEGKSIPIRAAFLGLKCLPSLFAVGHNNLNPELLLYGDHLKIKSVKKYTIAYNEIREISALKWIGTRNVRLKLKSGVLTHTANVKDDESFVALLSFLRDKGIELRSSARKQLPQS